jgi:hypothetical protein
MIEVPQLTHSELISFSPDCTVVWCTPSGRGLVSKRLPYPIRPALSSIEGIKTVIAVGGGQFLDWDWRLSITGAVLGFFCVLRLGRGDDRVADSFLGRFVG